MKEGISVPDTSTDRAAISSDTQRPVEPATRQYTRLNINLNDETAEALKELAAKHHISVTEAVRRAVAILKFVEDETDEGHKLQITDPRHNTVRELVLM